MKNVLLTVAEAATELSVSVPFLNRARVQEGGYTHGKNIA